MNLISIQQFVEERNRNANIQLLDVRENYEHAICSIGAIHIPMHEIYNRQKELSPTKKTFVFCKSGRRAEAVANLLSTEFGFKEVFAVIGGIQAYAEQVDKSLELYD